MLADAFRGCSALLPNLFAVFAGINIALKGRGGREEKNRREPTEATNYKREDGVYVTAEASLLLPRGSSRKLSGFEKRRRLSFTSALQDAT